ncbi:hypothetical protein JQ596_14665 [Bradyrhizobium manausense]|uniref:hypothetical protein n=1 Tax=Bradyrhizobium TaxID=374 RepID=UPI001BA9303D|nr:MULTISPECIES: hypothetical protein [Bradyrhizobium]MBR0826790.1 hypothetical protein [Bradyrhizobium manausense]UVO32076.1 hypothetical protein KUF59_16325 [Bradyrhizobium arachidis]
MRFGRDIFVLAACLSVIAGPAFACDVGSATAAIDAISQKILARQVKRIDLLKISDRLLANIPISPEHFASYSSERSTLLLTERDAAELAAAVKTLAPAQLAYQPDLRWQLVLLDDSGNKLHTIFFSKRYVQGRGRSGYVDGNMCSFGTSTIGSPALVKWLQKRL